MTAIDVATEPTDPELITRVREGDVAAYGALFSRHVDAATRLARHLVSAPDADDLVSEAFVKVLNVLLGGGGPDVAFRAYLLTAVRRLHVDKVRSTHRATPTDDLTPYDRGVPFTDTAVAGFEGGAAAKAFASLPERWQLVLWHLEVENQKPAEIAPLLGMSPNSVSALAYRAREGLRQAFLTMHTGDLADDECLETHERLGSYVRRGLARRDQVRVEEHLEQCRRCTSTYLELQEVNSSLSALLGPAVLGGVSAAYLGGGGMAALGGGGWAALLQLLDRGKDVVMASPSASMATASVVSMTTATAVVVGVQTTPLALPDLHRAPAIVAATVDRGSHGKEADTGGFEALDKMRQAISLGATIPLTALPTPTPAAAAEAMDAATAEALLPETPVVPVETTPVVVPAPDPAPPADPAPADPVPVDPAPVDTTPVPPVTTPTDPTPTDPTPTDPPATDPPATDPGDTSSTGPSSDSTGDSTSDPSSDPTPTQPADQTADQPADQTAQAVPVSDTTDDSSADSSGGSDASAPPAKPADDSPPATGSDGGSDCGSDSGRLRRRHRHLNAFGPVRTVLGWARGDRVNRRA